MTDHDQDRERDEEWDREREALRKKAVEASERVQKDKVSSKSGSFDPLATVELVERAVTCGTCKKTFTASGTQFGERVLLPNSCAECSRAEDTTAVGSVDVFTELERIGFNVRRHGRVKIGDFGGEIFTIALSYVDTVLHLKSWQEIGSLYFVGPTGTGKTQLMVAMARELIETGYPPERIVFVRARALITKIQDHYGTGKVDPVIDRLRKAGILFVDDAGTEKITRDAFRIVEDVLDAREGHPTVWSSNVPPDVLVAQWAEGADVSTHRFRSRLAGFRFVPFDGDDRRFES